MTKNTVLFLLLMNTMIKGSAQTFNQGHLCLDAPFTLGMSTNQNVDLLISRDDVIRVYL